MCSISAFPSIPKFYILIVTVLANFNAYYNDSGPDKLFSLKEVMRSPHWKNFEKVKHAEAQSFIKNNTWEY